MYKWVGLDRIDFFGVDKNWYIVNNYNIMRNGIHFVPRRSIVSDASILPQVDWAKCVHFAPCADFTGLPIFAQPVVLNVSNLQYSIGPGVLPCPKRSIGSDVLILPRSTGAE